MPAFEEVSIRSVFQGD